MKDTSTKYIYFELQYFLQMPKCHIVLLAIQT